MNRRPAGRRVSVGPLLVLCLVCAGPTRLHAQAPTAPAAAPAAGAPEAPAQPSDPAPSAAVGEGESAPAAGVEPASVARGEAESIEVTVVGTPLRRTAGSAQVLRARDLERQNYDDPHAALQSVPGVYARGEDGVGLRPNIGMRGVDPERSQYVTLMEDGVLFGPAPYAAPAAYYFPLITRMSQVRVVKGAAATSFGPQTLGGAIDLITRPIPGSLQGGADLTFGAYWHRKAHVHMGTSDGRIGMLIEGVHLANDGFKELPNGDNTGFYRNEWMIKGAYNLDASGQTLHELRLKLTYSDEMSNETYLGLSDADFDVDPLQRYGASALDQMKNHRTSFVLSHVYEPRETFSITTHVYRHDYSRTWRKANRFGAAAFFDLLTSPENGLDETHDTYMRVLRGEEDGSLADHFVWIGPNQREFVSQGIESRLRLDFATGPLTHQLGASVRLHQDSIDRHHSESPYNVIGGEVFPVETSDVRQVAFTAVNRGTGTAAALSVGDAISIGELTITPSARLEVIRLSLDDKLNEQSHAQWIVQPLPGVGAYYGVTEELGLLAGVYRGFAAPSPSATRDADTMRSWNVEAGTRYTGRSLRVELIGFWNEYQNLTSNCTFSTGCPDNMLDTTYSAGKARTLGFEALLAWEPQLDAVKLPMSLTYTLTQSTFNETFVSPLPTWGAVSKGDRVPYVPLHLVALSAGVDHKLAGGSASLSYVSAMREEPGQSPVDAGLHTDQQLTVDVTAHYNVMEHAQVYFNVRNLFDSMYIVSHRPFGARPNAPRWLQVGFKLDI